MDLFLKKVEAYASGMVSISMLTATTINKKIRLLFSKSDTAIPIGNSDGGPSPYATNNSAQTTIVNTAAGAAGALAGWAMSSLGKTVDDLSNLSG